LGEEKNRHKILTRITEKGYRWEKKALTGVVWAKRKPIDKKERHRREHPSRRHERLSRTNSREKKGEKPNSGEFTENSTSKSAKKASSQKKDRRPIDKVTL